MKDFEMRKVLVTPAYSSKTLAQKMPQNILAKLFFFALSLLLFNGASYDYELGGEAVYEPVETKPELMTLVQNCFNKKSGVAFEAEVPLKLKQGDKTIEFVADGYDKKNKIAYEWTSKENYYLEGDKTKLSEDEIRLLKGYQFGSTYIIVLNTFGKEELEYQVKQFIKIYKKNQIIAD